MAKVEIKNLVKRFGKTIAVDELSVSCKDKKLTAFLGPSGCGKTTTLRCICGLEDPDEGEIYIGNKLANYIPPKDRDVAMVFQSYALYPHMTVFGNMAFPLKLRKYAKQEIEKRIKEATNMLGITHLLDRMPHQLSGGEMQRTALGRAIVRHPEVFLMDEPLSNVDAKLRVKMRTEIKKLQHDLKTTTIYVTHDQVEAMTIADEIVVMNKGKLIQMASPREIYHSPSNLFVAGFIGTPPMNFLDCSFTEKKGQGYLEGDTFTFEIPDYVKDAIKEGSVTSEIVLGVRPEDFSIHKNRVKNSSKASVYVVEPLGDKTIINLEFGKNLLKAAGPPDFRVSVGEPVWITFDPKKIHVFNKKTGKVIY